MATSCRAGTDQSPNSGKRTSRMTQLFKPGQIVPTSGQYAMVTATGSYCGNAAPLT